MLVPPGKTYLRALPLLLRLQLARLTVLPVVLKSSSQSEFVVIPLITAPKFSAITSLKRIADAGRTGFTMPGEPELARQLAGSSGSPLGFMISSDEPPPFAAVGQPPEFW